VENNMLAKINAYMGSI